MRARPRGPGRTARAEGARCRDSPPPRRRDQGLFLRDIRKKLGKSQKEFADLLGISVRAIQSYEQKWRAVPPCVDKIAHLALYLTRREELNGAAPCWELLGCSEDARSRCQASQSGSNCGRFRVTWVSLLTASMTPTIWQACSP